MFLVVTAVLAGHDPSTHGPADTSPKLYFSNKLRPSRGIDLLAIIGPKTLRYLIFKSQRHGHFKLWPLKEDECSTEADLLTSLAQIQHIKICGLTAIELSFQTHYVQATLEQCKSQDAQRPNPVWRGTALLWKTLSAFCSMVSPSLPRVAVHMGMAYALQLRRTFRRACFMPGAPRMGTSTSCFAGCMRVI